MPKLKLIKWRDGHIKFKIIEGELVCVDNEEICPVEIENISDSRSEIRDILISKMNDPGWITGINYRDNKSGVLFSAAAG